jgi:hypothetical protein
MNYLKRYVNSYWKQIYVKELETEQITRKDFYRELAKIKSDIIKGTTTCDPKYHTWLNKHRLDIVPPRLTHKNVDNDMFYYYDIQVNPQKYLKHMIWMNAQLEGIKDDKQALYETNILKKIKQPIERIGTMYQFCPQRTNIIPKFIHIDNASIVKLLIETKNRKNWKINK